MEETTSKSLEKGPNVELEDQKLPPHKVPQGIDRFKRGSTQKEQ